MKKIILIYNEHDASTGVLSELLLFEKKYNKWLDSLPSTIAWLNSENIVIERYSDQEILGVEDLSTIDIFPTLILIFDNKKIIQEGYAINLTNENFYDTILEFFRLREPQPFIGWLWDEDNFQWLAPVPYPSAEELMDVYKTDKLIWSNSEQNWIPATTLYWDPRLQKLLYIINRNEGELYEN